jgi:hypothetical protein
LEVMRNISLPEFEGLPADRFLVAISGNETLCETEICGSIDGKIAMVYYDTNSIGLVLYGGLTTSGLRERAVCPRIEFSG